MCYLRVTFPFLSRAQSLDASTIGLLHEHSAGLLSLVLLVAGYFYDSKFSVAPENCGVAQRISSRNRGGECDRDAEEAEEESSEVFLLELPLKAVLTREQRCATRICVPFLFSFLKR